MPVAPPLTPDGLDDSALLPRLRAGDEDAFTALVNATIGFERLAEVTETPSKSLHRMLSPRGNPSMDNLSAIFEAVRHWLKVAFEVHTIKAA